MLIHRYASVVVLYVLSPLLCETFIQDEGCESCLLVAIKHGHVQFVERLIEVRQCLMLRMCIIVTRTPLFTS